MEQLITRPLADLYLDYVQYLDASPRTLQTYRGNLRQFVKWTAEKGIRSPTRADVIAYRDELKQRCRPSTVQGYMAALRLFFQWTAQAGVYPNVADHIKGAKLDTAHKKDYLTGDQIREILRIIDLDTFRGKRDYCIIALMATGGLRDVEISRTDVGDLGTVGSSPVLFIQGKGREERSEYVKVMPEVEAQLREYLKGRRSGPMFASLSNNGKGQRLTPRSISAIVKDRLVAAGFDSPRITAHSLRHSAVTIALQAGLPIEEVQQFARHRNISTTMVYAHHLKREENRSEAAIASAIF